MPKLSRSKIAAYFASEIANGATDVPQRLGALLLDLHRTDELDLIVADIERELADHGIIVADVSTAIPLAKPLEQDIRAMLSTSKNDTVILREHVDPTLIGGVKIRAAGRELDASVRHKLNLLKSSAA